MPLVYPPLLYLLGRMLWIGWKGRGSPGRAVWPVWLLLAATVFAAGFKIGLNVRASNVIDVGFAGVIGAQRIVDQGEAPYGHMPDDEGKECGEPDSDGYVRERIQTNGRCESANGRGDTYGPVSYEAYIPGYLAFGWTGKWDDLPAAHFTSILFDMLALIGLGLVGRRFGGVRLGATLAFAWAAYPFTQYVSSSNSNDAIMPALLIWGFWLLTAAPARGAFLALGAWTKFAALVLVPLWAGYPLALGRRGLRSAGLFAAGFAAATLVAFSILFLEPNPLSAVGTFWDRTFAWQLDRPSPFSIWDWNEYPGFPDLHVLQGALKIALLAGACARLLPRVRTPLKLAALTGAVLIAFELVLTHWFYLYIPWFFPFVAIAVLAPLARRPEEPPRSLRVTTRSAAGHRRLISGSGRRRRSSAPSSWREPGAPPRRAVRRLRDRRHPRLPALRRRHARRRGAVPGLRARVPARRSPGLPRPLAGWRTTTAPPSGAHARLRLCRARRARLRARRAGPRRARSTRQSGSPRLLPFALGSVVPTRFDLWPAALLAGALAALAADRSRLGLGLLAVAAAAKLYPLVVLPLALVYVGRRHGRRAALESLGVFVAVAAVIVVPFAVLSPDGLAESVTRQSGRPLQIESLGAALLAGRPPPQPLRARRRLDVRVAEPRRPAPGRARCHADRLPGPALVAVWVLFARRRADAGPALRRLRRSRNRVRRLREGDLAAVSDLAPAARAARPRAAAGRRARGRAHPHAPLVPGAVLELRRARLGGVAGAARNLVLVALVALLVRELSRPGRAELRTQ